MFQKYVSVKQGNKVLKKKRKKTRFEKIKCFFPPGFYKFKNVWTFEFF